MKAIAVIEKNGQRYGYALSSSKIKTTNELLKALEEVFDKYQVILLETKP